MIRNLLIAAGIASLSFAAIAPVTASAATTTKQHESRWAAYLTALAARGLSRDPPRRGG